MTSRGGSFDDSLDVLPASKEEGDVNFPQFIEAIARKSFEHYQ